MTIVFARPGHGKALALDTPLPTPTGWTTMGDVTVGDELLSADGQPTRVVAATEVMLGRPCYEIEFSDGTVIVADAQHQWLTQTRASPKSAQAATVTVQGHHLAPGNTRDAVKHGVAIVPQELASIEDMTVYENLFVGRELHRGRPEPSGDDREAEETLAVFDVAISPTARMGSLPSACARSSRSSRPPVPAPGW